MGELRFAFRSLRATPMVSAVAALSLALGIGANTAIFSLVNSLLLRTLPVADPGRLALVSDASAVNGQSWTFAIWENIRQRAGGFAGVCAWSNQRFNLAADGETQPVDGVYVSGGYFSTLGVAPLLGRTLTDADDVRNGGADGPVAVISYAFWQRYFGGAADVVGRSIAVERVPFTVVGVTPPDFFGAEVGRAFDVALPLGAEPLIRGVETNLDRRSSWWLTVVVRLKPEQSIDSAAAVLRAVQPQIRQAAMPLDWTPKNQVDFLKEPFTLFPAGAGTSGLRTRYQRPLLTILVVVALVLLIACANIANLLLARATARRHELSVRVALGAPRWHLARQLLLESVLLSAAGALLGLLFAVWGSRALVAQLSTQVNRVSLDLSLDWRVVAFTTGLAGLTALLFGTAPALRAAAAPPMEALKEQGRGAGGGQAGAANALVIAQVALSLVLVVAAGLFVRTFSRLAAVRLGFDRDRVLVVSVNAIRSGVDVTRRAELFDRIAAAVAAAPGVAHAAASVVTPVSGSTWNNRVQVPDAPEMPERERSSLVNLITPGWFAAYGTRILAGRDIDRRDARNAQPVALVNEAFIRKFFPGRTPATVLGRTVEFPGGFTTSRPPPPSVIVGVVEDAVYRSLREPIRPTLYQPLVQYDPTRFPLASVSISIRGESAAPSALARTAAAAITSIDREVAFSFRPLAEQVDASLTQERLVATLSGFFGGLALLLAGLGLYGVTAYAVSRRRAEIAIRMALGAGTSSVVRLVLARVGALVLAGVGIGVTASMWASRYIATLLYGLEPRDPATLAGAAVMLATIGTIAGWLPAHRASRIDPAEVLRDA